MVEALEKPKQKRQFLSVHVNFKKLFNLQKEIWQDLLPTQGECHKGCCNAMIKDNFLN